MRLSHTSSSNAPGEMSEVLDLIQRSKNSLLLFGAIHTEDEMWAALLLAKHLQWPVVADILSGLRLRTLLCSFPDIERNFMFVDNLDHVLLSDTVKGWLDVDVVIQVLPLRTKNFQFPFYFLLQFSLSFFKLCFFIFFS